MSNLKRLPRRTAEVLEWQQDASCRNGDVSMFFLPDETARGVGRRREIEAKAICAHCPVRPRCAAHALTTREQYGIWGGFTEAERRRLLAMGWEDLADRRHRRVDVARLTTRLANKT